MTGSLRNSMIVILAMIASLWPVRLLVTADRWIVIGYACGLVIVLEAIATLCRFLIRRAWVAQLAQTVCLAAITTLALWQDTGLDRATMIGLIAAGLLTIAVDCWFITMRNVVAACIFLAVGFVVTASVYPTSLDITSVVGLALAWVSVLGSRCVDHCRRWPRVVESAKPVSAASVALLSLLAGALALILTALSSLMVPAANKPLWHSAQRSQVNLRDPRIELEENLRCPDNVVVLHYRTSTDEPVYLRTSALSRLDSQGWGQTDMTLLRSKPHSIPGLTSSEPRFTTQITVDSFVSDYLPAPYAPVSWEVSGRWSYDPVTLTILNTDADNDEGVNHQSYSVTSIDTTLTPEELAGAQAGVLDDDGQTLTVPDAVPESIVELASTITAAASSDGIKASMLQAWLSDRDTFTYRLQSPEGSGFSLLENFLLYDHSGYCIHFASAMALLARIEGIPARVAIGFSPGTRLEDGSYEVRAYDMHAWTELYFDSYGWVSFDPTVSQDATTGIEDAQIAPQPQQVQPQETQPQPQTEPTQALPATENDADVPEQIAPVTDVRTWLIPVIVALGVVVLICVPGIIRAIQRARRLRARNLSELTAGVWAELAATMIDYGYRWSALTPRQIALTDWPMLDESTRSALIRIALAEERARYADRLSTDDIVDDLDSIRRYMASRAKPSRRLQATLWPKSVFSRPCKTCD